VTFLLRLSFVTLRFDPVFVQAEIAIMLWVWSPLFRPVAPMLEKYSNVILEVGCKEGDWVVLVVLVMAVMG